MICKRPDRDVPELLCGYPLPCPHHTILIDTKPTPPTITIPATITKQINLKSLRRLKKIANIIKS